MGCLTINLQVRVSNAEAILFGFWEKGKRFEFTFTPYPLTFPQTKKEIVGFIRKVLNAEVVEFYRKLGYLIEERISMEKLVVGTEKL